MKGKDLSRVQVRLAVPKRHEAFSELPRLLAQGEADLYVFPEGFLRSPEELAYALQLTENLPGTLLTGYQEASYEKVLALEEGKVVDSYTKCILTAGEREKGKRPGPRIRTVQTGLGKLAVPVCYDIHFPEVPRIMCLEPDGRPMLMVNPIGTGMHHSLQYRQWLALARARAIENEVPVVGCCHFCGQIPLAFAFDHSGEILLEEAGNYGIFPLEMDFTQSKNPRIGYEQDRRPHQFLPLCGVWEE